MTPERRRELLFDYVYGLLNADDPNDAAALAEIASQQGDPAWEAELAKVRAFQARLALAAQATDAPAFAAPVEPAKELAQPTPTKKKLRAWLVRYALAACVLIVGGSVGVVVGGAHYQHRCDLAQARLKQLQADQAHRQDQVHVHERQLGELQAQIEACSPARLLEEERRKALAQAEAKNPYLNVVYNQAVEAGAPNRMVIEARTLTEQPATLQDLEIQVFDKERQLVLGRDDLQLRPEKPGVFVAELPQSLEYRPGREELFVEVTARLDDQGGGLKLAKMSNTLQLNRTLYLTHLATDKPMYQPGEEVHFRALTLERHSLRPVREDLEMEFVVTSPRGEQVYRQAGKAAVWDARTNQPVVDASGKPVRGVGAGSFPIDPQWPGGQYTLTVRELRGRFLPEHRRFLVNAYEKPRLRKELDFTRKSYGPGDQVLARCRVSAAEGGRPLARQPVFVSLLVDGQRYDAAGQPSHQETPFATDALGAVEVRVQLPATMERGDATLAVRFTDGANVETLAKPIPVVLNQVHVEFFPEGGDLIAGVPNVVYFHARTTRDLPAELTAKLVDAQGQVVAELRTFADEKEAGASQGMGKFTFTPRTQERYRLVVDRPLGATARTRIPEVRREGVLLHTPVGVVPAGDPIQALVQSVGSDRRLLVGAFCRGRMLDAKTVVVPAGKRASVELRPLDGTGGVVRLTVFEQTSSHRLTPVAERLLYRLPATRLDLQVKPARQNLFPGERVKLALSAAQESGQSTPALVTVAVVDKNVLTLADEKTYRQLPTHFLLTHEVRKPEDLEYADFLLSSKPQAATALDLLLGTQGWRRFAEQAPQEFAKRLAEEGERYLAQIGQTPMVASNRVPVVAAVEAAVAKDLEGLREKVEQESAAKSAELMRRLDALRQAQGAALANLNHLQAQLAAAEFDWNDALRVWQEFRLIYQTCCVVVAVVLLLVGLVIAAWHQVLAQGWKLSIIKLGCYLGVLFALLGLAWLMSRQLAPENPAVFSKVGSLLAEVRERGIPDFVAKADEAVPAVAGGWEVPAPPAPPGPLPLDRVQDNAAEAFAPPMPRAEVAPVAPPPQKMSKTSALPPPAAIAKRVEPEATRGGDALKSTRERVASPGRGGRETPAPAAPQPTLAPRNPPTRGIPSASPAVPAPKSASRVELADRSVSKHAQAFDKNVLSQVQQAPAYGGKQFLQGQLDLARSASSRGPAASQVPPQREPRSPQAPAALAAPPPAAPSQQAPVQQVDEPGPAAALLADMPPFVVREYALVRALGATEARRDFAETLYWHPLLLLPAGQRSIEFDLGDSITTYQVAVFGHDGEGRLGAATFPLEVRLPLNVEPKLPIEITATDRVQVPVAIANGQDEPTEVQLQLRGVHLQLPSNEATRRIQLPAHGRDRALFSLRVPAGIQEGQARVLLDATAGPHADSVERLIQIVPDGFPVVDAQSDVLEGNRQHDLRLPPAWIPGTVRLTATFYPSPLADLQSGLEGLLREPHGCFEQASSANYPNTLILNYLRETTPTQPRLAERAQQLLARGYQRLISYECEKPRGEGREGYEWFGGRVPPHEALTAYGLLQFRDMSRVHPVDESMLERTRQFLLSRRDGRGGYRRNPRALDSFGRAPEPLTHAYITWALSEAGTDDLSTELDALEHQAKTTTDPYFLALAANSLLNRGRVAPATAILRRLTDMQQASGALHGETTSITGSGGRDLQIETTALAVLAWLKVKPQNPAAFHQPSSKAIRWLCQQRGGYGGFGSTQATILALKALLAHAQANQASGKPGEAVLSLNGIEVQRVSLPAEAAESLVVNVPEAERLLQPGNNRVLLTLSGPGSMPYTLSCAYRAVTPLRVAKPLVSLETKLEQTTIDEGATVRLHLKLTNQTGVGQGMTVAILGLPAGLTLPEDHKQLREYTRLQDHDTKPGRIDFWEVRGRELILYWRELAPTAVIELPIDLIGRVPGSYRGPASRAYLYYNADAKHWVEPLQITIRPR